MMLHYLICKVRTETVSGGYLKGFTIHHSPFTPAILLLLIFLSPSITYSQELFSYTEPASNMAAKSIGIRMNNMLMKEEGGKTAYHLNPEIMWGVSRKIMVHADMFFGNGTPPAPMPDKKFSYDGASLYLKYRFYSQDEVHNHFRMAGFGRLSGSKEYIHQPAIDLHGHNTGYEVGVVATKLAGKVAIAASSSFLHANDNGQKKFLYDDNRNALGYTLSIGKLMLPKEYTNYSQTNMNLMLEMLGQHNLGLKRSYLDMAPSVQFILLSKMRVDLGYRFPLINDLARTADKGFLVRFEYNFFNVYK